MTTLSFINLRSLLVLAGAEAFKRKEMLIKYVDVAHALRRLNKPLDTTLRLNAQPSAEDLQALYKVLFNAFGPGINMTLGALSLLWQYHLQSQRRPRKSEAA